MNRKTELQKYQDHIQRQLKAIAPIFANAELGDFSRNVVIPRHKSELTEFFLGVQVMLDAIRDKINQLEVTVKELKKANRVIENEKARAEAILNSLGDGLITFDKRLHTTFINQPAVDILGQNAKNLGQDVTELMRLRHKSGLEFTDRENPLKNIARSKKQVTIRLGSGKGFYLDNADNVQIRIAFTLTPIRLRKTILGAVIVFRDITEEANTDRSKSEIVSLASHQLRTPLTTIRWYINELIKRKLAPKKRSEYLEQIQASNQRMINLVEHLLNVSRIDLGTLSLKVEPLDISKLIDNVIDDLAIKIKQKDLKIVKDASEAPKAVYADRDSLRIVLQNLISNAEEYSHDQATIIISIGKQDGLALIKVTDTGVGIPADQQYHIFTKLFRATNANSMSTTGSGLGLYVSKALVEQMGGKIWFTSKENIGTTMFVTVPIKKPKGEKHG